MRYKSF